MRLRSSPKAVEEAQRFGALLPDIVSVFLDLKDIESLEQMADAAEKRKLAAEAGLATSQAALDQAAAKQAEAQAQFERTHQQRSDAADAEIAAKKQAAAGLLADAESEAAGIRRNAVAAGDEIRETAKSDAAALSASLVGKRAELDGLNRQTGDAQEQLAALQDQITQIEKQKAQLLQTLST